MRFVVYDIEASGPDPRYDQILSVAAVLTDDDFKALDRIDLCCRLRPHQLPAAEALLLTGLSIEDITDPSRPSHMHMLEALRERFLAWQPAVFTGYSSLEFDEPLLANSLRRCRFAADLAAAARLDLQRLALGLHEFFPDTIAFSARFDGKPSFRLVDVARANGITPGRAHDAMGDVETTIALAKLIRQRAPAFWEHMLLMGMPGEAERFAEREQVRLYTEFHHNRPHHWLVTALGPRASGEVIGFDLSHDPSDGQRLEGDALRAWLRHHPRPLRLIRTGDCPFILPRDMAKKRVALDALEAERRAKLLVGDEAYRRRLIEAHAMIEPPAEPELQGESMQLVDLEEHTDRLDDATRVRLEADLAHRMLANESSSWMTLNRAFDEADRSLEEASAAEAARLEGLLAYLRKELAWAEARDTSQNRSKANW